MHMIRHDLHLNDLGLSFGSHVVKDLLQALINPIDQYRAAVFRTPDDMVLAGVNDVAVTLELPAHAIIILHITI